MKRREIVGCLAVSGLCYYAVMISLGLRTLAEGASVMFDALWWSAVAMALHWWFTDRQNAGR